jgi:hypothetical protein
MPFLMQGARGHFAEAFRISAGASYRVIPWQMGRGQVAAACCPTSC